MFIGQNHQDPPKWSVIVVDFSNHSNRVCVDIPDSINSDYKKITILEHKNACILGSKHHLLKRKPEKSCFNDVNFEMEISLEHCLCHGADFECDLNYWRENMTSPCTLSQNSFDLQVIQFNCRCDINISFTVKQIRVF